MPFHAVTYTNLFCFDWFTVPLSQVKTLYSEFSDIKKGSAESKPKPKDDIKKQQQKKPQQQQQKIVEKPKDNKPKTLDAAINRVGLLSGNK